MNIVRSFTSVFVLMGALGSVTPVTAQMSAVSPYPMVRGVNSVDIPITITGSGFLPTDGVTVDGIPATMVGTPSDTELTILLPDALVLPQPGFAHNVTVCRQELVGSILVNVECRTAGVSGDQPTAALLPIISETILPDYAAELGICHDTLYVRGLNGLHVLDVSDPAVPLLLSTFPSAAGTRGLDHDESLVFMTTGSELLFIDVTEPDNPVLLSSFPLGAAPRKGVLTHNDQYVFLLAGANLLIIDRSDPAAPTIVQTIPEDSLVNPTPGAFSRQASNLHADGNLLYVSTSEGYGPYAVSVVDVRDPSAPVITRGAGMTAGSTLEVQDEVVYGTSFTDVMVLGGSDLGLYSAKGRVPLVQTGPAASAGAPVLDSLTTSRTSTGSRRIDVNGNHAYTLTSGGVEVLDIRDPAALVYGTLAAGNIRGVDILASGDRLYVAQGPFGVAIVDLSGLPGLDPADEPCGETAAEVSCDTLDELLVTAIPNLDNILAEPGLSKKARDHLEKARGKLLEAVASLQDGGLEDGFKKLKDAIVEIDHAGDEGFADAAILMGEVAEGARRFANRLIAAAEIDQAADADALNTAREAYTTGLDALSGTPPDFEKAVDQFAKAGKELESFQDVADPCGAGEVAEAIARTYADDLMDLLDVLLQLRNDPVTPACSHKDLDDAMDKLMEALDKITEGTDSDDFTKFKDAVQKVKDGINKLNDSDGCAAGFDTLGIQEALALATRAALKDWIDIAVVNWGSGNTDVVAAVAAKADGDVDLANHNFENAVKDYQEAMAALDKLFVL